MASFDYFAIELAVRLVDLVLVDCRSMHFEPFVAISDDCCFSFEVALVIEIALIVEIILSVEITIVITLLIEVGSHRLAEVIVLLYIGFKAIFNLMIRFQIV